MPDVSSARAERLVNLVLCLLSTRQFLSAERIRTIVPGYADAPNDEAFFRMFERDKTELRELGVPLESGRRAIDTADGYRIARQDYELGEIDLEVDEDQGRAQPRVRGGEPAFGPLLAAVQAGRAVTFDYRRGGPAGEVARRTVEPWGVVSWRGRWYVVGHDRDRAAPRSFRVSRIVGPVRAIGPSGVVAVPSDVDLLAMVRGGVEPAPVVGTARVWVAEGRAYGLRRLGRLVGPRRHAGRPGEEIELDLRSLDTVARWLAGHGPDIAVLEPQALSDRVRANWEAAAAAHADARPAASA